MDSSAIAARMREIAAYLRLDGETFRARAYDRAAASVEATHDLERLIAEGRLTELPRVGASLARLVEDLSKDRPVAVLDSLRQRWPKMLVEIADLPGIGAARARRLFDDLQPRDLEDVAAACAAGRVRDLPGFGPASEARIAEAIARRHERSHPMTVAEARPLTEALASYARGCRAAVDARAAGAARRWIEVVDRLAIAVSTREPLEVLDHMSRHPLVLSVEPRAGAPAILRMQGGVLCDLHTAPPERFGAALVLATGSPEHVALLDVVADTRGAARVADQAASDEAALYRALGLPELPPEVRDGTDEVTAAVGGEGYADLVRLEDLRGAVHCHTVYSDGKHTVEEMARAAMALGLDYITITDHSPSAHYAGGLTVERLREQWAEIAAVQERLPIRILRGTESDIRADGELDYPPDVLAELDITIASIHQRFKMDEDAMTRRIVTAMRQPGFKVWGHALGRLLLSRDPVPCRIDEVLDAIAASDAAVELNGDPKRMDLAPDLARRALARGTRFVLSADAHSTGNLAYLENAIGMARRARLRARDVLNTLPVDEFAAAVRPAISATKLRSPRAARRSRGDRSGQPSTRG
ncbi:MAG TPA: PHP domain-containing protein [Kofleriaceae bacterium]|nr:PHP domain-containing protein [Kofleriaceae bacterium]